MGEPWTTVEEDMEEFCQDCPDKETCVIDPEEFEDECPRLSSQRIPPSPTKEHDPN